METTIKKFNEKDDGRDIIVKFVKNDQNSICKII